MVLTINKLGDNRVLITLCGQDMNDFSLDFNSMSLNDSRSRRVILRIMQVACRRSGISMNGKKFNIEALSLGEDCYLLVTVDKKQKPHTYRLKRWESGICYSLGGSTDFLNAMEQLFRQNVCCGKNSVYELDGEYFIMFDYPSVPPKFKRVLSEFSFKSGGKISSAKIREKGRLICERNAIAQIGRFL